MSMAGTSLEGMVSGDLKLREEKRGEERGGEEVARDDMDYGADYGAVWGSELSLSLA